MFRIIKYAIYILIAVALFYFLKNLFSDEATAGQTLQTSVKRITIATQQIVQNAYQNWQQKTESEGETIGNDLKSTMAQIMP